MLLILAQHKNPVIFLFTEDYSQAGYWGACIEVCGVTADDVVATNGRVLVTGKGSKQQFVYLGKMTLSAAWLYTKDKRPEPAQVDSRHLFLTVNGYAFTRHTLRAAIVSLAEKVRIHSPPVSAHGGNPPSEEWDGPD